MNRPAMRRSVSTSALPTTGALSRVNRLLPDPSARRPIGKENTLAARPTFGFGSRVPPPPTATATKRAAPAPKKPAVPAKRATPAKAAPPAPGRFDFKGRINLLTEKNKELRAESATLKREKDEYSEELAAARDERDRLAKENERLAAFAERADELEAATAQARARAERAESELEFERVRTNKLHSELEEARAKAAQLEGSLADAEIVNTNHEKLIVKQGEEIENLRESTQKLHWERRELHNKLQDLKGNIRVVCRVRPALAAGKAVALLNFPDACTVEMERIEQGTTQRLNKHAFKFDRVFGPKSGQDDVWEEISCLIQSALDGYNVCIFAYGQTGSGKTYTMEGSHDAPGVIPKCCTMIFDSIKQLSKSGWQYSVYASFLEIYNEQLYDLLDPSKLSKDLDLKMADANGSDILITNLSEQQVNNDVELLRLVYRAQANRLTAATANNERSSRSHSVARIKLIGHNKFRSVTLTSRICLVDLAGSESAKTTLRMEETKNINRSLSELGNVITALRSKQNHIPFRNSKLTRLLEPQLGGAAKALLVAAAAPYEECSHESLSTFRFATQVGHCSTASARRNLALAQPVAVQSKDH